MARHAVVVAVVLAGVALGCAGGDGGGAREVRVSRPRPASPTTDASAPTTPPRAIATH